MLILSSFTYVFQTLYDFLLLNTKEDILKNVDNRTVVGPHWLYYLFILLFVCSLDKNTIEVNGDH